MSKPPPRPSSVQALLVVAGCCLLLALSGYLVLPRVWQSSTPRDELLIELTHKNVVQRRTAARCIREMRPVPENYIAPLMKALDDQDPQVRQSAAEALGEVGIAGRPFVFELSKLSNDHQDSQVRFALQQAVQRINVAQ